MQLLQEFVLANLQFLTDEVLGTLGTMDEHVAHGEELRLLVLDDAAVGRDVDFAVGEGIESVDGLVARYARCQMHLNLHLCRCQVGDVASLDLALLDGLGDALDERRYRLGVGQFANHQRLLVQFFYLRTHLHHAATLSVVVFRHVDRAARLEVRIQVELLTMQIADGRVADFAEVVGQNLG